MLESKELHFLGQTIFFETVARSGRTQRTLARAALAISGDGADYPVQLAELVGLLPWEEHHNLLALWSLRASSRIKWLPEELEMLKHWAA